MQYVEIFFLLLVALACVILYRYLIHSNAFTRFLNSFKADKSVDVEADLDSAEEEAKRFAEQSREDAYRTARAARRIRDRFRE